MLCTAMGIMSAYSMTPRGPNADRRVVPAIFQDKGAEPSCNGVGLRSRSCNTHPCLSLLPCSAPAG